jgi:hypothetical protein
MNRAIRSATANLPLPPVLCGSVTDGLPLEVPNRVRSATGERLNVILPVARTSAGGSPLETPFDRANLLLYMR